MPAIALQHREHIIAQVAAGHYLAQIAHSLGLAGKGQAISNALANDPEYQAARELGLESKLATRETQLEECEPQNVPRARELLSHARWRAEREAPHRWGAKQQVTLDHRVSVDDRLTASLDRLIGRVVEGQHSVAHEVEEVGIGIMVNSESDQSVAPTQQIDTLQAMLDE